MHICEKFLASGICQSHTFLPVNGILYKRAVPSKLVGGNKYILLFLQSKSWSVNRVVR